LLFILPGVYLIGRLLPVGAVIVAEPARGVIGGLRHGWALTAGQGWRVTLFFLVIMLITTIAYFVASLFIELPVTLIAGRGGVPLLSAAVEAAGSTAINLLSLAVTVAVYRRLSAD
jgi:phage shock protein PspC (stress-responsive transcriptional regulator)